MKENQVKKEKFYLNIWFISLMFMSMIFIPVGILLMIARRASYEGQEHSVLYGKSFLEREGEK